MRRRASKVHDDDDDDDLRVGSASSIVVAPRRRSVITLRAEPLTVTKLPETSRRRRRCRSRRPRTDVDATTSTDRILPDRHPSPRRSTADRATRGDRRLTLHVKTTRAFLRAFKLEKCRRPRTTPRRRAKSDGDARGTSSRGRESPVAMMTRTRRRMNSNNTAGSLDGVVPRCGLAKPKTRCVRTAAAGGRTARQSTGMIVTWYPSVRAMRRNGTKRTLARVVFGTIGRIAFLSFKF